MGARRNYEVARMLEDQNALSMLHTDTAWAEGSLRSRAASRLLPHRAAVQRRTIAGLPAAKITSSVAPNIVGAFLAMVGINSERKYRIEDFILGLSRRVRGLGNADTIVSVAGNGGVDFLRYARRRGMKIAADIVITPLVHEILAEEHSRFEGWGFAPLNDQTSRRIYREHIRSLAEVCHLLICPSKFVAEGLVALAPQASEKIVIVPYSLGGNAIRRGYPEPRRVLFAGEACLRKGISYLGDAAKILRSSGIEVRVAGYASDTIRQRPELTALNFLGHLPRGRMAEEFSKADVFCLPSVAEGMASVTLEALAHGVPCIVTPACGSPIKDGVEGRVVKERDGEAIAAAISQVVGNRALRSRMSDAAIVTAKRHAPECIAPVLYGALASMHAPTVTSLSRISKVPDREHV